MNKSLNDSAILSSFEDSEGSNKKNRVQYININESDHAASLLTQRQTKLFKNSEIQDENKKIEKNEGLIASVGSKNNCEISINTQIDQTNKFHRFMSSSGDYLCRILPRSKYHLPLRFQGKKIYTNNRLLFFSVSVFFILLWNYISNIMNVGKIQSFMILYNPFMTNEDLKNQYNQIKMIPIQDPDDKGFYQRLPFYQMGSNNINDKCSQYPQSSNDKLAYGYLKVYYENDQSFQIPFSCKFIKDTSYMYVDETISDILVQMIDAEYKNSKITTIPSLSSAIKQTYPDLNFQQEVDNIDIKYFEFIAIFSKFCSEGEYFMYQLMSTRSQVNIEKRPANRGIGFIKHDADQIKHKDNQQYASDACDPIRKSWIQRSYLQKKYITYTSDIISSFINFVTLNNKENVFYSFEYQKDNQFDFVNPSGQKIYQTTDHFNFGNKDIYNLNDMVYVQIQSVTLQKSLSAIGGFQAILLGFFGIFIGLIYPQLFLHEVSTFFIKKNMHRNSDKEDKNLNQQEIKQMKEKISKIFSYERFFEINEIVESLQEKIIKLQEQNFKLETQQNLDKNELKIQIDQLIVENQKMKSIIEQNIKKNY